MNQNGNFFQHFLSLADTQNQCNNVEPIGIFYKYQSSDPSFDTNIEVLKDMIAKVEG